MSRPKNTDQILLALRARLLQFDVEYGATMVQDPVKTLVRDLKAIFSLNTKVVSELYIRKMKEIEGELNYVLPQKFESLHFDARKREGVSEDPTLSTLREKLKEQARGVFRCINCYEVVSVESPLIRWNSEENGYEHLECNQPDKDIEA